MNKNLGANLIAFAIIIIGIVVFAFNVAYLGFLGSVIVWLLFAGISIAIVLSGENDSRIEEMEARIRKLEENQKGNASKGT